MLNPLKIFIAYSRKDEKFLKQLKSHFSPLERSKRVEIWYDGMITPGIVWEEAIKGHINKANIILLLISSDAIGSNYFYEKELKGALERHEAGTAKVIPLILRPCAWQATSLAKLQALPKNGKPVISWPNPDSAYNDAVLQIIEIIKQYEDSQLFLDKELGNSETEFKTLDEVVDHKSENAKKKQFVVLNKENSQKQNKKGIRPEQKLRKLENEQICRENLQITKRNKIHKILIPFSLTCFILLGFVLIKFIGSDNSIDLSNQFLNLYLTFDSSSLSKPKNELDGLCTSELSSISLLKDSLENSMINSPSKIKQPKNITTKTKETVSERLIKQPKNIIPQANETVYERIIEQPKNITFPIKENLDARLIKQKEKLYIIICNGNILKYGDGLETKLKPIYTSLFGEKYLETYEVKFSNDCLLDIGNSKHITIKDRTEIKEKNTFIEDYSFTKYFLSGVINVSIKDSIEQEIPFEVSDNSTFDVQLEAKYKQKFISFLKKNI